MPPAVEPISDDELLFRRVPANANPMLYDSNTRSLSDQAFAPHKTEDVTGLSIYRSRYTTVEEAARGRPGKLYFVAKLRVSELRQLGFRIEPRPDTPGGFEPGHAELVDLNSANRRESRTLERQRILRDLCFDVEGPFETPPIHPAGD